MKKGLKYQGKFSNMSCRGKENMLDFVYKERYGMDDFRKIIELLRSEDGCPWDREQTHSSIRRNLLEEAYEVCGAIDEESPSHLQEELGDLLMQILFHARIEEEAGRFSLDDVADAACKKLILRHPHVFGGVSVSDSAEVLRNWDEIKRREKSQETAADVMDDVTRALPALWRTEKVQKKARKLGFDMRNLAEAMDKLREETEELQAGIRSGEPSNIEEELGDILFCAVNAARFLDVDPEMALHSACDKFIRRFRFMEDFAAANGRKLEDMTLDEMEEYYQLARRRLEDKDPPKGFVFKSVILSEER
jgi:tetrapyrrole methylase family protein/MazG family protein